MKIVNLPYISANLLMEKWNLYALDLYVLIITTSELPAYEIIDGRKISQFTPTTQKDTDIEKIVKRLLFKYDDIIDVENKYRFDHVNEGTAPNTETDKKEISPEIFEMISNATPEVERLYTPIKKIGFSGKDKTKQEQYRDAAINYFRKNKNEFKLVTKEHLSDCELYSFRDGHAKDDFIGKLLQKIAHDLELDINNYQELYKIYKSTKRLRKMAK